MKDQCFYGLSFCKTTNARHIRSYVLRQGRVVWPIAETNQAPRQLTVENIQTDLSFFPNDLWSLDHFTASFAGARIKLSGTVANGSAVR